MKAGDRVKVVRVGRGPSRVPGRKVGDIGIVEEVGPAHRMVLVLFDADEFENQDLWYIAREELEVINEA